MRFSAEQILEITGGKLVFGNKTKEKFVISTDTRTISQENLFIPLKGASFDGHDFIAKAMDNGVVAYLVDNEEKVIKDEKIEFVIAVNDCLEAYLRLANYKRKKVNPKVIAITGSSGKTTTKELVYSVLSQQFKTHKSKLNHNNEIGLCQTIMDMPDDTEFLVIEMGMRGLGEIELLSKYSEPDVAVITNVGTAHLGRLGSVENIAKAKCEIAKFLNKEGILIAHKNEFVEQFKNWAGKTLYYELNDDVEILNLAENSSKFAYKGKTFELSVPGEFNILNSLAAIEIGYLYGMLPEKINVGLKAYKPIENRWQIIELKNNVKIINDAYNANPDSVKATINAVVSAFSGMNKILVLGDMAELGDKEDFYHSEIGKFLTNKPVKEVITVGDKAKLIAEAINDSEINTVSFTNNDEVVKYLKNKEISNSLILFKASRCMALEKVVEKMVGE